MEYIYIFRKVFDKANPVYLWVTYFQSFILFSSSNEIIINSFIAAKPFCDNWEIKFNHHLYANFHIIACNYVKSVINLYVRTKCGENCIICMQMHDKSDSENQLHGLRKRERVCVYRYGRDILIATTQNPWPLLLHAANAWTPRHSFLYTVCTHLQ